MFCGYCGKQSSENDAFCSQCGQSLSLDHSNPPVGAVGQTNIIEANLPKMVKNMKFVGLFGIIYGALSCITIVGAIWGVPMIMLSLRLRESADALDYYRESNDHRFLEKAFERLERHFFLLKIVVIMSLVIIALYILTIIILAATGSSD